MALPTTNLTLHVNASDNDHLFEDLTKLDTPEDGDNCKVWTDDDGKDLALVHATLGGDWVSTPMLSPAMDFDSSGSGEFMALFDNTTLAVAKTLDDICNAGAKTLILALQVKSATLNDASPYNNHLIFSDGSSGYLFWGLYLRTSGGIYYLQHYNYDGNADVVEAQILLDTTYVVTCRHNGTNVYIGLDGAAEASAASGNTTNLSGQISLGDTTFSSEPSDIIVGELATWDAALTGTDLTDANDYFTSRWLAGEVMEQTHYRWRADDGGLSAP